jgi:hypothetical protein
MSDTNKDMSEEDYLKRHLGDIEAGKKNTQNNFVDNTSENIVESTRTSDLQYLTFDVRDFPCGKFYPVGTMFMVRAAQVREIQAYSMVDDTNFYDVVEKMNDMLQACVRIKYTDGRVGSFLEVKDQDRIYLIFLIRELTFQQGNSLSVNTKCTCGQEVAVELKRENFRFHKIDEKLDRFYSPASNSFSFKTINGGQFEVTPPNIGLQKAFTDYIIKENNEKKAPNLSFLKIIPFMLNGRTSITMDGIKAKLVEFEQMEDISFQFLNAAIGKMTFGIEKLGKVCACGEEVTTDMTFPNGTSGIFVIHDAFEAYIKE